MRKKAALAILIVGAALSLGAAKHPAAFANVSLSFWRAGSGNGGIVGYPELREVLVDETLSFSLAGNDPASRILEKEGYAIAVKAGLEMGLVVDIFGGGAGLYGVRLMKPSGAEFIFYDADSRKHGVHVSYTVDDHRVGMVSPGILR